MDLPKSYTTLSLPDIKLSHHPASSSSVTPIILLILDRPKAHNAFTKDMTESLVQALRLISRDPRVKCVVLTGSDPSNRHFCAGADLNVGFRTGGLTYEEHRDLGGIVSLAIHHCRKPVIAALNGSAVGVGITMTLPAAIRVASRDARVGFVFSRRGIAMEACSAFFLPRLIGSGRAMHLVTTGETVATTDKLVDGLFSYVVEPAEVVPKALKVAEDIAKNTSTVSTGLMRDLIYRAPGSAEETHLLDSKLMFDMFASEEVREGVESFMEKRPPRFKGEEIPRAWPWWDTKILEKAKI